MMDHLFGPTGHVSWAQECGRSIVIFAFGLLLVRLAGRRAFARWSALDIVVAIIVGSSLSRAQTGNAPFLGTIAGTGLMMLLHWIFARASAVSRRMSVLIEGPAIKLGDSGSLCGSTLLHHNVSEADVMEALRQTQLESASDARLITLEPSGKITVLQ